MDEQEAPVDVHNKQKVPIEAHDEQQAPIELYNKQRTHEDVGNAQKALEEAHVPKNNEISISYVHKAKNRFEIIFFIIFFKWP